MGARALRAHEHLSPVSHSLRYSFDSGSLPESRCAEVAVPTLHRDGVLAEHTRFGFLLAFLSFSFFSYFLSVCACMYVGA